MSCSSQRGVFLWFDNSYRGCGLTISDRPQTLDDYRRPDLARIQGRELFSDLPVISQSGLSLYYNISRETGHWRTLQEIAPTRIRGPLLMCWQLVLSISQIVAAAINRGTQGIDSTVSYRVPMNVQLIFR
jgi:hypothetical protein